MKALRWLRCAPAALIALICASALSSCGSGSPSVLDPHSPEARRIAGLFWLMLALATVVYFVVVGLVLLALRRRGDSSEPGAPDSTAEGRRRTNWFIVIGGLAVPILVLSVVATATVGATRALQEKSGVIHIEVDAQQFWWRLTYPDDHVVSANEIHIPVGQPVELTLTSDNVIHSFWVPQLHGKKDTIPGQPNRLTFTAQAAGEYRGQCAEFCGIGHALMAILVIAQPEAEYRQWLADNAAAPAAPTDPEAIKGQRLFENGSCAGCHAVAGTAATATFGPDLSHFGSRQTIAALTLPNDPDHLARWLAHTQDVKPGARMPDIDLTAAEIQQLVAYLESTR